MLRKRPRLGGFARPRPRRTRTRTAAYTAYIKAAGALRTPAATWIEWELLDEGLDPILREVDEEGERDGVHEPVDFGPLALEELDENPRDEAGADATVMS